MADIYDLKKSQGYTYSDKDGVVTVYDKSGQKPPRNIIIKLLWRARNVLLKRGK